MVIGWEVMRKGQKESAMALRAPPKLLCLTLNPYEAIFRGGEVMKMWISATVEGVGSGDKDEFSLPCSPSM